MRDDQLIVVVYEISYLGVSLENAGGWKKYKMKQTVKGNQTLVAIDKCLTRTPDMNLNILENIYEMMCESRLICGAGMWRLEDW
jgi:hypothetical protein